MRAKGGLGRGLAALIPAGETVVQEVDIDLVAPNPRQPRGEIDAGALAELSESIAQHGILQPLVVTRDATAGGAPVYRLIAGERRLHAARLAGLTRVPVVVREAGDRDRLELALVENLQRADLNPLEEARAFRRLAEEFGLTQEEIARRVGRGRVAVANAMRLLGLGEAIQASLAAGEISAGHARALLGLESDEARWRIVQLIREQGLSVRQTEALVQAARDQTATPAPAPPRHAAGADPEREALEERLRAALATRVQLIPARKGGRIVIRYYDDDNLQELLRVLLHEQQTGAPHA